MTRKNNSDSNREWAAKSKAKAKSPQKQTIRNEAKSKR